MTAVEWLYDQIKNGFNYNRLERNGYENQRDRLFEQAKEMEKEQIINAALYGFRQDSDGDDWQGDNYNAEKYYAKTFKSE